MHQKENTSNVYRKKKAFFSALSSELPRGIQLQLAEMQLSAKMDRHGEGEEEQEEEEQEETEKEEEEQEKE